MKKTLLYILLFVSVLSGLEAQDSAETDFLVTIGTSFGDIKLILFEDTPNHRENFLRLANAGLFDSTRFYRIIDNFVIQGGNPRLRSSLLNYEKQLIRLAKIPSELKEHHKNVFGALGAPTRNPGIDSNAEHFYIVENANGAHHLDGKYTVFGQVMSGFDTVMKIASVETNEKERPLEKIYLFVTIETVLKKDIKKFYNYKY